MCAAEASTVLPSWGSFHMQNRKGNPKKKGEPQIRKGNPSPSPVASMRWRYTDQQCVWNLGGRMSMRSDVLRELCRGFSWSLWLKTHLSRCERDLREARGRIARKQEARPSQDYTELNTLHSNQPEHLHFRTGSPSLSSTGQCKEGPRTLVPSGLCLRGAENWDLL